jgi:hypothetical protein
LLKRVGLLISFELKRFNSPFTVHNLSLPFYVSISVQSISRFAGISKRFPCFIKPSPTLERRLFPFKLTTNYGTNALGTG